VGVVNRVSTTLKLKTTGMGDGLGYRIAEWPPQGTTHRIFFDRHFWVILFLIVAGALTYYVDQILLITNLPF